MKDVEDCLKNIVPSPSYNFLKIKICLCLHYMREKKTEIPENCFYKPSWGNHSSKSSEAWFIPSWGEYVHIWFGDLRNCTFFRFYRAWKLKNPIWLPILDSFWPIKSLKEKSNNSNPQTKSVDIHPRKVYTKCQNCWLCGFLKKVHRSNFRVSWF